MTMAILLNGMDRAEIRDLTLAMIASGERMDFAGLAKPTTDKHSTGGVGDKITLPLAPLVASFGVAVPQLSGRGLGHTGGTLDKLESIPGWRAYADHRRVRARSSTTVGAVICAAGAEPRARGRQALRAPRHHRHRRGDPADRLVDHVARRSPRAPRALVLDVKFGSGAFMQDPSRRRELARTMVALGTDAGRRDRRAAHQHERAARARRSATRTRCARSVEVLAGGGPADVVELTVALAREMLALAGLPDADVAAALRRRPGHGHLARDDRARRAATRTRRCPTRGRRTSSRPTATACSSSRTRCRSASRPGGSAPAARASRIRCSTRAGIDLHVKPGDARDGGPAALHPAARTSPDRFAARARGARGRLPHRRRRRRRADGGPLIAARIC